FEEGNGFDGSSIRGWQPIHASDMLVVPDPTTAVMDPFTALPTLSLICNIVDPLTKEDYSRDPRNIARKAEAYLKSTGIGAASCPVQPTDTVDGTCPETVGKLAKRGYRAENDHREVPTAGQAEIDLRSLSLVKMGDALMCYKHTVKNVARRYGKTATFMPKP